MKREEINTVYNNINNLVQNILIPIRAEKKVDRKSFDLLYIYLDELVGLVKGEEMIPRKLTGLLFFIYTSLSGEIQNNDYRNPIFMEVSRLEEYLGKIYWDSPFGKS